MTYTDVARTLSVPWCQDCALPVDHRRGVARGRVHWTDRKVNRQGLRRFLLLSAGLIVHNWNLQPRWAQIYLANAWAYNTALHQLHVRMPSRYSDKDRTIVRYMMERDKGAITSPLYPRARAWAKE